MLFAILCLVAVVTSQSCNSQNRTDCGYVGINQPKCEAKGCCWQPATTEDTPWCFYKSNGPSPPPSPPGPPPSPPTGTRTAFVHLFEWKWTDIAVECEKWLGPHGVAGVQVSPPMECIQGDQWWTRYQPVSYKIASRSGNRQQFQDMVTRCKNVGVEIYVDAVINHMANGGGTGIAGTSFGNRAYSGLFQATDMHHNQGDTSKNCVVNNFKDKFNVQHCDLLGLPDLDTGSGSVRGAIGGYLKDLTSMGVAGFRVDAAKHIDEGELGQIQAAAGQGARFICQEVSRGAGEPIQPDQYTGLGGVTEFDFAQRCAVQVKNRNFDNVQGCTNGLLPSDHAVTFVDNHDTERGGAPLTYKDGQIYRLATTFLLAWDFGYPKVMSGYNFDNHDQGPPSNSINGGDCGSWTCAHRWPEVLPMFAWRNTAGTNSTANLQTSNGQLAFSRGACFVAINTQNNNWNFNGKTGAPAGSYMDVISHINVTVGGDTSASFSIPAMKAVAFCG